MNLQAWLGALLAGRPLTDTAEPPALLAADADRVTDYVFETPGLPEMRGASAQLKALNDEGIRILLEEAGLPPAFVDDDPPGCLVYAAGGGVLALVPQSKAEPLRRAIERLYPERTGAATTTCVVLETTPEEVSHRFGELVKRAGHALRTAKGQKTALPFFELLPFVSRCAACNKRPTTQFLPPYPGEPPEPRCRVCAAKREEGQGRRSAWHKHLGIEEVPSDLEEIAEHSQGYIGVVYADGNGLGDWFQEATTPLEYRRRSRNVQQAVETALLEALRRIPLQQDPPFEVILVGGDDVLLIVPAGDALPVAHALCGQFGEAMAEDRLTMSAGVVIAECHTPVYFLRRLAADLLRSAKRRAGGEGDEGGPVSAVDFLVLKAQGTRSIEHAYECIRVGKERLILHHGPYTLEELERLLEQIQRGKQAGFPRSQLHALREALRLGRHASALTFLYQQARASDKAQAFLNEFARTWSDPVKETPPWRRSRRLREGVVEYRTPWADLVDLWDFMTAGGRDAAGIP